MKRKLLLSIFLLLTGLFTVSCSNDSNVTINESQIEDAITAGLEKEPYKRGDISLTLAKCDIDYNSKNLTDEDNEILEKTKVQEFLDKYADEIGESKVEIGKPVKRECSQKQCKELRLTSNYLEKFSESYTKNYYKTSDGNYVIELTKVDLKVNNGVTNTLKTKDVITFDERSYIIHEEATTSMSMSGIDVSMKMETLAISDVVYYDSYSPNQELVELDETDIKNAISVGLEKAPYTSGEMDYLVENVDAESYDSSILDTLKENVISMIAYTLCVNASDIEIGVQKHVTFNQEKCNKFRLTANFLNSLTEENGYICEFYKILSNNTYVIKITSEPDYSINAVENSELIIFDDHSYIIHYETKIKVNYDYGTATVDAAYKYDINYR